MGVSVGKAVAGLSIGFKVLGDAVGLVVGRDETMSSPSYRDFQVISTISHHNVLYS